MQLHLAWLAYWPCADAATALASVPIAVADPSDLPICEPGQITGRGGVHHRLPGQRSA